MRAYAGLRGLALVRISSPTGVMRDDDAGLASTTARALLITHQTNGIHLNALDRQRLKRARYQGNKHTIPEEVTAEAVWSAPGGH